MHLYIDFSPSFIMRYVSLRELCLFGCSPETSSQEVHLMLIQPDSHQQAMHSHSPTVYSVVQGKSTMHLPTLLTQDIMLQKYNIMLGHCCKPSWLQLIILYHTVVSRLYVT